MNEVLTAAPNRAAIYDNLIGVFLTLPDEAYLEAVRGEQSRRFLEQFSQLEQPDIAAGCRQVLEFLQRTAGQSAAALLEILAVDRTRLLRAPFQKAFRLPYEREFCEAQADSGSLQALNRLYTESGYLPKDSAEPADFFAIELDFLRVLILKMLEPDADPAALLKQQRAFLSAHPGAWVGAYIDDALPHAETDFYRGWLTFLRGFLALERAYLDSVL